MILLKNYLKFIIYLKYIIIFKILYESDVKYCVNSAATDAFFFVPNVALLSHKRPERHHTLYCYWDAFSSGVRFLYFDLLFLHEYKLIFCWIIFKINSIQLHQNNSKLIVYIDYDKNWVKCYIAGIIQTRPDDHSIATVPTQSCVCHPNPY